LSVFLRRLVVMKANGDGCLGDKNCHLMTLLQVLYDSKLRLYKMCTDLAPHLFSS